jgi:hypothetical protein
MTKGPGECREDPEADVANFWFANLSDGLQGIKGLKKNLAATLVVSAEAKTHDTIVAHVEADQENTPQLPTWCTKCQWISCRKNTGYHTKDPKDSNAGGCICEIYSTTEHGDRRLNMLESTPHDQE